MSNGDHDIGGDPYHAHDRHPARAVILAGGRGTRLAPYTSILPKPLMPIGDQSILEIVVDQLFEDGFDDITFSVGYLSHLIRAVFDARAGTQARITYTHEESALGTAGPLRLVNRLDSTFLVMNGDVLTNLPFRQLMRLHQVSGNVLTIACNQRRIKSDYGILHLTDHDNSLHRVVAYDEKPETVSTVSMGVYVCEPRALEFIPPEGYFDIPHLVQALLDADERVGAYVHQGAWFDIGRREDYEEASTLWGDLVEVARAAAHAPDATGKGSAIPADRDGTVTVHNLNGADA